MVKLMILVVLLVALIALTHSAPQTVQDLEKEYEKVYEKVFEELLEKEKQADPLYGEGYVCCNKPPKIPDPNSARKRGHAFNLIKRAGIGYGGARSIFSEFPRRNAVNDLPQDDSFDSIDTGSYGSSSRASTLALVKRLMKMANRKRVGGTSLRDDLAAGDVEEPLMVLNYPGKRGGFVRGPTGPGGNNLSFEDFMTGRR